MQFAFEAMTRDGRIVHEQIEAGDRGEAVESLRGRGLIVTRLSAAGKPALAGPLLAFMARFGRVKSSDLVLFTRQMKMLLESGSALVPALQAIEQQTARLAMREIIRGIREHVEKGGRLTEAFQQRADVFRPVFTSMVAAGEATATLPATFQRLADLSQRQQQVRATVIGALIYPTLLITLMLIVSVVMLLFVIPRFRGLFTSLNAKLPASTEIVFALADAAGNGWPYAVGAVVAGVVGLALAQRSSTFRNAIDDLMLRLPIVGRMFARLALARVLRVWAAMLRSHVPLLETVQQSRSVTRHGALLALVTRVEQSVCEGGRVGRALSDSGLVEPVVASAISTGEENGRLAESVDFVSSWIDEDNHALVGNLTRLAEPLILACMGVLVGGMAMSMFVPLFDLATSARH